MSFQQMGDDHSPLCDHLVPDIGGRGGVQLEPNATKDLAALQVGTHAGQWTELGLEAAVSSIKL